MIKLAPEENWGAIKTAFVRAAPEGVEVTQDMLARLAGALESGERKAWRFGNVGIAITGITVDEILGRRELVVYAAANLEKMTHKDWADCFEDIRDYAVASQCTHISYLTRVKRLLEIGELLGGDVSTHYVSIPIGG